MIRFAEALDRLLTDARPLAAELLAPADALGRIVGEDVISPIALPSFDHSAMDGFALRAGAATVTDSEHVVLGSQAAGDEARASSGMAWEIMTGARLPEGLDAVVPVERTQLLASRDDGAPTRIRLLDAVQPGDNVRYAGSDVPPGAVVMAAGTCIEPAHVMLLAALGVPRVPVVRRARVAIICTGKELVTDPTQPLGAGQIHNSNGPYLSAALTLAGAEVVSCETVDDTGATFIAAVQRACAARVDLIVSTGAVSMGRYDFIPQALRELGAELLFHKVAMRPGKPVLAAAMAQGPLVLALPGTPMAVAVGLRFLIAPLLRAWAGQAVEGTWRAVLASPQALKPGLRHFLRGVLRQGPDGRLHVEALRQPQPFRIRPFAQADAWIVVPEDTNDLAAGTLVEVASLQPGRGLAIAAEDSRRDQA